MSNERTNLPLGPREVINISSENESEATEDEQFQEQLSCVDMSDFPLEAFLQSSTHRAKEREKENTPPDDHQRCPPKGTEFRAESPDLNTTRVSSSVDWYYLSERGHGSGEEKKAPNDRQKCLPKGTEFRAESLDLNTTRVSSSVDWQYLSERVHEREKGKEALDDQEKCLPKGTEFQVESPDLNTTRVSTSVDWQRLCDRDHKEEKEALDNRQKFLPEVEESQEEPPDLNTSRASSSVDRQHLTDRVQEEENEKDPPEEQRKFLPSEEMLACETESAKSKITAKPMFSWKTAQIWNDYASSRNKRKRFEENQAGSSNEGAFNEHGSKSKKIPMIILESSDDSEEAEDSKIHSSEEPASSSSNSTEINRAAIQDDPPVQKREKRRIREIKIQSSGEVVTSASCSKSSEIKGPVIHNETPAKEPKPRKVRLREWLTSSSSSNRTETNRAAIQDDPPVQKPEKRRIRAVKIQSTGEVVTSVSCSESSEINEPVIHNETPAKEPEPPKERPQERLTVQKIKVLMPVKPYKCQMQVINAVIKACTNQQNCLIESPTGSGKTLALLCGALAWQTDYQACEYLFASYSGSPYNAPVYFNVIL